MKSKGFTIVELVITIGAVSSGIVVLFVIGHFVIKYW